MMSSNFLARFRPPTTEPVAASIYETIRQHDEDSQDSDIEERAGLVLDRQNLAASMTHFEDTDLGSSPESDRRARSSRQSSPYATRSIGRHGSTRRGHDLMDVEELDDDVPASLLIEGNGPMQRPRGGLSATVPVQDNTTRSGAAEIQNQWQRAQTLHNIHPASLPLVAQPSQRTSNDFLTRALSNPKDKALWRWIQVEDLDRHLFRVYNYYTNHGYWAILLKRFLNLATSAFVIGFTLFLTQCIDYSRFKGATKLADIQRRHCTKNMGFVPNALLWLSTFFWIFKVVQYVLDLPALKEMHDFYLHLLNVPENEIQSISWQEIVSRLMALRDSNPNIVTAASVRNPRFKHIQNKQRMDAQDIANRLMRRDNYMVAMINKDILDMTLPVPGLRNRQLFTRTLEWNLNLCIMDYVFGPTNQVRAIFLKDTHRKALSEGLRRRFKIMGVVTVLCAPFLVLYFLVQMFFRYFNEYQKDPAQIGRREYNMLAQWKFREFNELHHLFQRRLNMSHPFATRYLNQFPKDKTIQAARFVTFVAGAVVGVLGLATIFDQENFLSFEVTPGRTAIFYIGIFGTVWAVARGMLPDDHMVYDSSFSVEEVIDFTHYRPAHWEGRLHTVDVKQEFEHLYQMQIFIFAEEILSMIFTPFVLWFSLTKCSDQIIDFFREFTVHVDGVGYVCSFAEFNMKKPGNNVPVHAPSQGKGAAASRNEYFASKDQKLEQSYWGFMNDYARNPQTDVRFPYRDSTAGKRKFHMPPPFPGLLSPQLDANDEARRDTRVVKATGIHQSRCLSPARRGATIRNTGSTPFQSLLLDAHHQPIAVGAFDGAVSPQALRPRRTKGGTASINGPNGARTGSKNISGQPSFKQHESTISERPDSEINPDEPPADLTATQPALSDPAHAPATPPIDSGATRPATNTDTDPAAGVSGTKSREGMGSWKYPENGLGRSDTGEDEDDVEGITGENAGILGLVRQFTRVQGQHGL